MRLRRKAKQQGIAKLGMAFARVMRGAVAERVYLWRLAQKAAHEAAMASKLAARMRQRGLHKLQDAMARVMRGVVGMRVYVWVSKMRRDGQDARDASAAEELERSMWRSKKRGIAKLGMAFARVMRGAVAERVYLLSLIHI